MSTPAKPMYAFGRCYKLKTIADLDDAQRHADRDPSARFEVRPGTSPDKDQIRWTRGAGDGVFDLVAGWRKAKGPARERGNAPICMHLILGVSPEWVQLAGGLHDQANPCNLSLLKAAHDFVEAQIGRVAATRLDLDEMGGGVVDVFCVPVYGRQRRLKKDGTRSPDTVAEISMNKAFDRLRDATGESRDYAALQTAWARHAQSHLDPALLRGERKSKTGRKHLETRQYKELIIETKALEERAARAKVVLDQLEVERKALEQTKRSLEWREAGVARQEEQYRTEIDREVQAITRAWTKCASGQQLTDADRAAMGASMAVEASSVLEAGIEAVKAEKAAQAKRAEELLREEERVAGLRHAAEDRKLNLDRQQEKIDSDEEANRTRDAALRIRATELDQRKDRLRVAEEEVSAAQELAAHLEDEAKRLMSHITEALRAILRRWLKTPEPADEKLLGDPKIAPLAQAAEAVSIEIKRQRELINDRLAGAELAETANYNWEERLDARKSELDSRDAEVRQLTAEIAARETKLAKFEQKLKKAVADHNSQVARDLQKLASFAPALEREFAGRPAQGDQQILDDPLFSQIVTPMRQTRQRHDADLTSKRAAMAKLDRDMTALEQTFQRIKAVGPALVAWLERKLTQDQKAVLQQPEARPFVDAFSGAISELTDRRKRHEAQMLQLNDQITGLDAQKKKAEQERAEAQERLDKIKKEAEDLADLIKVNQGKADQLGRDLSANLALLEQLAAHWKKPSAVTKLQEKIEAAKAQVAEVPRLRRPHRPAGMELD